MNLKGNPPNAGIKQKNKLLPKPALLGNTGFMEAFWIDRKAGCENPIV